MYNIAILLFFLNSAALLGWNFRPTEYKRLCRKFDRIGAETIFRDAKGLIDEHAHEAPIYGRYVEVYPLTNSLSAFGNSARVRSNRVSITTAGMGSFRAGIGFLPSNADNLGTAHYWATLNTGEGYEEHPIYPKDKRD